MWKKGKVLAVSSPGGHWVQLNKICNQLEEQFLIVYASPRGQYKVAQQNERVVHNIMDASADSKIKLLPLALQLFMLVLKERPATIISTGAAPGAIAILLGKILGIKTIWIDSIANVQRLSRSGRMIQAYADIVLTQWPAVSDGKKILYKGSVL
jgi:UDP-N-acetylglucosamine:LPS N-acetylglucosamine transferase